jgi:hypothetical protein
MTREWWPWLALAGLGMYHGLNPATGWLFAVALGLNRRSRATLLCSLVSIALGHALAAALVVTGLAIAGSMVDFWPLRTTTGIALLGWAFYHALYSRTHRVRVGMQTGSAGLVLWSFLMAGTHGAGLMMIPALMPVCLARDPAPRMTGPSPALISLAAVGLHTLAMLVAAGAIAIVVYEWIGIGFLRRGWINFDRVWTAALFASGFVLVAL